MHHQKTSIMCRKKTSIDVNQEHFFSYKYNEK